MGRVLDVRCPRCDKPAPPDGMGACADCGVVFDIRVDLAAVPPLSEIRKRPEMTIWRWRELLPIQDPAAGLSGQQPAQAVYIEQVTIREGK